MKQFVLLCVLFGLVVAKERTITVKGTGIIDVEPDQAVVYFTPYSNSFSGKWTSQTPADVSNHFYKQSKRSFLLLIKTTSEYNFQLIVVQEESRYLFETFQLLKN
eukprot:TRINITY_DN1266_c0_g1_i2.p1 TRINITY_DN1266_c0_g1~~TRINITY_DN1266_c0_g1_i2.p1  ORF type:complete len:105 (+),score=25.36 TRINITY_DN1266_c0_g1_i2:126-440(+)